MSDEPHIVIKKIKKKIAGGHHGGGWKVAYADFVTAMMAFFLMMWLLNATSEEQRRGISNYFGPVGQFIGAGGTGGVLSGRAMDTQGRLSKMSANSDDAVQVLKETSPSDEESDDNNGFEQTKSQAASLKPDEHMNKGLAKDKPLELKQAEKIVQKYESELFKQAEKELRQAIMEIPELKELQKNLIIDQTPEGLRIQIIDKQQYSMFPKGSFAMYPHTKKLLELIAKVIKKLPNKISITGHTDSFKFSTDDRYSNWELSSDRANASRRVLLQEGIPESRILYVAGKSDTEPLLADTGAEMNRRISIILHRTDQIPTKAILDKNQETQNKGAPPTASADKKA
ncbi:MAG: OmpA family protein [Caedimonadaceae bacterium]|nr:MAG: OmpA family protein [Caedimonadaceae bacterium]